MADDDLERHGESIEERVLGILLRHVDQDRYPSTQMLDLLERNTWGRSREALAEVLLAKIAEEHYPSPPMIRRLLRISQEVSRH